MRRVVSGPAEASEPSFGVESLPGRRPDIKQLAHYYHDAQHESYLTNLPVRALVGVAGADHEYLRGYEPPQLCSVREGLIEELVAMVFPWIEDSFETIQAATEECEDGHEVDQVSSSPLLRLTLPPHIAHILDASSSHRSHPRTLYSYY